MINFPKTSRLKKKKTLSLAGLLTLGCTNSHMLAVAVDDLVSDGILVWQVLVMQEMLPALHLLKVPDLSWGGRRGGKKHLYLGKVDKQIKKNIN